MKGSFPHARACCRPACGVEREFRSEAKGLSDGCQNGVCLFVHSFFFFLLVLACSRFVVVVVGVGLGLGLGLRVKG